MPIYYKKVNPDSHDLSFVEAGLGTGSSTSNGAQSSSSPSTGSSILGSLAGVHKKLSNFAGSRSSLFQPSGTEVELESITANFADESDSHIEAHLDVTSKMCLDSKSVDRDRIVTKFGIVTVVKQFPLNIPSGASGTGNGTSTGPSSTSSSASEVPQLNSGSPTTSNPPTALTSDLKLTPPRPVIITYHDIGLNYFSNFESFFSRINIRQLLQDFRIYHINAPGQEEHSDDLSHITGGTVTYQYPTMDDLAEQIGEVCKFYNIQEFIGFGYGAGANVLSRFALSNADMVEALFLINPSATTSTWSEWFYQKMNVRAIYQALQAAENPQGQPLGPDMVPGTLPQTVQDYFIWHNFGNLSTPDRPIDHEAVQFYRRYLASASTNRFNLYQFIEAYVARTALGISREDKANNFRCPVAVMCGDYSPHVDESVKMNARLDPTNSTWMKLGDCAMPLEEQPDKVSEVLRLFLQGLGYTLKKVARQQKAFLAGKSMPSLYMPVNERLTELRRDTICVNEV